jgi:hypothetical protein
MSNAVEHNQLDFDRWMELARKDPEKFESMRLEAIDEVIQSVSGERQMHLRRLQWRIDRARERAGTPMAATIAISKMMWDAFYDLKEQYQSLFAEGPMPRASLVPAASAEVIAFRPRAVVEA